MSGADDGGDTTLLGTGTWTKQGPATLVLRENAWVVLVPGARKQMIEAVWTVLGEKPAPEDFLDRLVEVAELESAEKLTALLCGFHDGSRGVFGVKGSTPIAVYTAEGSQQIVGTEDGPFVLRTLDGVRRTAFGDLPPEDGLGAPRLESGIVRVRGFVHVTTDPADLEADERAALAGQVEEDGRAIEDPEVKKRRAERPAPKPASTVSAPETARPAASTRTTSGTSPAVSRTAAGATGSSSAAPEPSAPNMFDGLFGGGSAASGSAAPAAAAPAPVAAPAPAAPPAASGAAEAAAPPAPTPAPTPEKTPSPVPASSSPEPTAAPTPAPERTDAPARTSSGIEAAGAPAGRKRRLVSSSLFDRRSPSAPEDPSPAAGPAPEGAATPAAPAARTSECAPTAAPTPRKAPTAPAVPTPAPPVSIPTPEPPEDEGSPYPPSPAAEHELTSPVTQIAPIDDEDERDDHPALHAATAAGTDLENTGAYDDLFGKTVFRRIEDAAVRRAEEDEEGEGGEVGTASESESAAASPETATTASNAVPTAGARPAPEPEQAPASSEFIDWVPGVGRTAPEIAQTAARRAAATPAPEPAYPQVHMAERPPAPNTGSRPAPTQPSRPPQPAAPYEQAGPYPSHGGPMNTGAAGHLLGTQARPGQPPRHPQGPVNPGAAGYQVGFPGPPAGPNGGGTPGQQAPGGYGGQHAPAPGWAGSPNPPRPPQFGAGQAVSNAVALPGLVCANGHANSPERAACRFCGAPLQGPTRTVARPPLGMVLISGGGRFVLDRTAIIGRRPRASRVSANDVPQLITVPSPQQDISRSHLELRLEGWHVVALDLGATNGTTLYREGFEPVRLRPREGVVLYDGDHLDLGDDVHLMFGERV